MSCSTLSIISTSIMCIVSSVCGHMYTMLIHTRSPQILWLAMLGYG